MPSVLEVPAQGGGDGLEQVPGLPVLHQLVGDLQQDPLLVPLPGQAQVELVQLAQAQDAQGEGGQEAGQEHQVGLARTLEGALAPAAQAQAAHQAFRGAQGQDHQGREFAAQVRRDRVGAGLGAGGLQAP